MSDKTLAEKIESAIGITVFGPSGIYDEKAKSAVHSATLAVIPLIAEEFDRVGKISPSLHNPAVCNTCRMGLKAEENRVIIEFPHMTPNHIKRFKDVLTEFLGSTMAPEHSVWYEGKD